jgi:hypothetical protein
MSIKRRISPGSIKVFDVALLDEFLVGLYTKIQLVSQRDTELYVDIIDPNMGIDG